MILELRPTAHTSANHLPPRPYRRSPRSAPTVAVALLLFSLLLPLAGCGSSNNGVASKSASEIIVAARTAAQRASSVHVVARSNIGRTSLTLDASLARQRGQAQVSFVGLRFAVIRVGKTLYLKGNRVLDMRLEKKMGVKVPAGLWLKGTTGGALAQLGVFTDITREVSLVFRSSGRLTKGARVKIAGQPAILLKQAQRLYTGTLSVATTGEPYPIKLVKTGQETGQTTFTGWNDPVEVRAPANAIDISQLEHAKGR